MQQRRAKILGRAEKERERERERERLSNVLEWAKLRTMKRANENACNMQRERKRNFLSKNIFCSVAKVGVPLPRLNLPSWLRVDLQNFIESSSFCCDPYFRILCTLIPGNGSYSKFRDVFRSLTKQRSLVCH